ncbi:MAG: hypothetical protein O7J95_08525 [Planctomycetota bacterium]|nr:hypothetical protein [Planctomycetota bacterium]
MITDQHGNLRFGTRVYRQILDELANPKAVFTLHVSDGPNERVIYFVGGGVRILSVGERSGERLDSHLLSAQILDIDGLHEILEFTRKNRRSLKEALVQKNVLTDEQYATITAKLVREELLDLVFWEDAYFNCHVGAPPQEIYQQKNNALIANVDCVKLGDEVAEWSKLWERLKCVLHSDRALVSTARAGRSALERREAGDDADLLELCLEPHKLRSVWKVSSRDLPDLCRQLDELVRKDWMKVKPPRRPDSGQALGIDIARLEESLPRVIGKDLVREKLVALYRKAKLHDKAVAELQHLALAGEKKEQWPLAIEYYKKALAMQPGRLDLLEKILQIYFKQRRDQDAIALAQNHARVLLDAKRPEEARAVARLLKTHGSSREAAGIFAALTAHGGDAGAALEQYLNLAEEYELEGELKQAKAMLREAFKVAPDNPHVRERLEKLDPGFLAQLGRDKAGKKKKKKKARLPSSGRPAPLLVAGLVLTVGVAALHWSGVLPLGDLLAQTQKGKESGNAESGRRKRKRRSLASRHHLAPADGGEYVAGYGDVNPEGEEGIDPGEVSGHVQGLFGARGGHSRPRRPSVDEPDSASSGLGSFFSGLFGGNKTPEGAEPSSSPGIPRRGAEKSPEPYDVGTRSVKNPEATQLSFQLAGFRQAPSLRNERICYWKPGLPAWIFDRRRKERTQTFPLPTDTAAVAAGRERLALRQSDGTFFYTFDGQLLGGSRELPAWSRGFFTDDELILLEDEGTPGIWVLDPGGWSLRWRATYDDELGFLTVY